VIDVREAYLDAALEVIQVEYGSVSRYLEKVAALDAARLERLRSALLV
jgi:protein tyrosine/serine phosphatase